MLCSLIVIWGGWGNCDLPMEEFKGRWLSPPPPQKMDQMQNGGGGGVSVFCFLTSGCRVLNERTNECLCGVLMLVVF